MFKITLQVTAQEKDVILTIYKALQENFKIYDRIDLAIISEPGLWKVNIDKHEKTQVITKF